MPIYEFRCENGHLFDVMLRMSDPSPAGCVTCGAPVVKVLSAPAIHFKGSGFYSTDYGKKGRGPNGSGQEESKSGDSAGSKSSDSSGDSGSDSSSSGSSSSDAGSSGSGSGSSDSSGSGSSGSSPATSASSSA